MRLYFVYLFTLRSFFISINFHFGETNAEGVLDIWCPGWSQNNYFEKRNVFLIYLRFSMYEHTVSSLMFGYVFCLYHESPVLMVNMI